MLHLLLLIHPPQDSIGSSPAFCLCRHILASSRFGSPKSPIPLVAFNLTCHIMCWYNWRALEVESLADAAISYRLASVSGSVLLGFSPT
jgi:hypothetical protein